MQSVSVDAQLQSFSGTTVHELHPNSKTTEYYTSHVYLELMNDFNVPQIKSEAHLLSVFVLLVMGVVSHGRQELQEAVERVTVACWEQVDQQLCNMLLLICI